MGCFDIFCPLCGLPYNPGLFDRHPKNYEIVADNFRYKKTEPLTRIEYKKYQTKYAWLRKCHFMTSNNKLIRNCVEVGCNIVFRSPDGNKYNSLPQSDYLDRDQNNGYFIHADCYKFVKQKYGINLLLKDFLINQAKYEVTLNSHYVDFKQLKKYWNQYYDFIQMIIDKRGWMGESPLKNARNAARVKTIFNALKIKADRPGPSISATFYKNGTIKLGNDGYFWTVKQNKWIRINQEPVEDIVKMDRELLKRIPQIGHSHNMPLFIKEFTKKTITLIKLD